MFNGVRVGDKVYDFTKGWGTVIKDKNHYKNIFVVKIDETDEDVSYLYNGKKEKWDKNPSVFWAEPELKIPKNSVTLSEALRLLEEKDFNPEDEYNCVLVYDVYENTLSWSQIEYRTIMGTKYFTKDSIIKCFNHIHNKHISYEEFMEAYNEVFKTK